MPSPATRMDEPFAVPFHGIVSKGLLQVLREQPDGARMWLQNAHRLDRLAPSDPEFGWLAEAADSCGVLTYPQSRWAAELYVHNRVGDGAAGQASLRHIREGHTSSVWVVETGPAGGESETYVLNVARDRLAGVDLVETSVAMQDLARTHPELPLARVEEVVVLPVPRVDGDTGDADLASPPLLVPVVRVELIDDALEVHTRPNGGYLLVDQFHIRPDEPATITHALGRPATAAEVEVVGETLRSVTLATDRFVVEIDEGDLVWSNGRAVVVALS